MQPTIPLPGDFGLTQISGEVGKLIRFGQWLNGDGFENFEHAFIYVGGGFIVEAEPGGARTRPVTEYANILWSTGHFNLTPAQRRLIALQAVQFSAKKVPYSFLDYLSLAAHRLHIPGPFLEQYIKSEGHMICSQLVDACYAAGDVDLFTDGRWDGDVTPGDLYGLLQ